MGLAFLVGLTALSRRSTRQRFLHHKAAVPRRLRSADRDSGAGLAPTSARMLTTSTRDGGIEDIGLGLSWDAVTLGDQVDRRAAALSQMGIGRGSVVSIGHGGTARFFADLFATWRVGAAAACLDPSLTPGEVRNVVEFSKSAVLLVDGAAPVDRLAVPIVDLSREHPGRLRGDTPPPRPEDPALLLFTSGTTGTPKGVVLSFEALRARINANIAIIGKASLARALVSLPTHFGHGLIGNSLTPLMAGGDIVLHPLGIPLANDLSRIIDQQDITFMSSVPAFWRMALTRSPRRPAGGSLVRVHVGSAPFSAELWSEVATWSGAEVVNCYGATETANWIAGASSRDDGIADGLVGKMWGGDAAVMDESGSIQHRGAGEIILRSPSFMSGYLDRPDLTAAALHQGWYRTGDRGSIDEHGRLWLTGRIKDEINRAGFKVQPAEIDAMLERNPAVAEACVFGISRRAGRRGGRRRYSAEDRCDREPPQPSGVVSGAGAQGGRSRALVLCFRNPAYGARQGQPRRRSSPVGRETDAPARPIAILRHLRPCGEDPAIAAVAPTARNAVELAWTEVLGRDSYIADLALNQTGGDSLDAMRMWLLIEKTLGRRLLMDVLESDPTPSQLSAAIERQLCAAAVKPSQSVFLMLPAEGDSPTLSHFRSVLKDQIRFVLIEYPGWREMIDAGAGFEALVDAAVAQICGQSRENECCLLAGYSFGGLVAVETARRLAKRGRQVGFLGLIDTRVERPADTAKSDACPGQ